MSYAYTPTENRSGHRPLAGLGFQSYEIARPIPSNGPGGEVINDAYPQDFDVLPSPTPKWFPTFKEPAGMECDQAAPPEGYHYELVTPGIPASSGGWIECPTYRMVSDEDVEPFFRGGLDRNIGPLTPLPPEQFNLSDRVPYNAEPSGSSLAPVTVLASLPAALPSSFLPSSFLPSQDSPLTQPIPLESARRQTGVRVETGSDGQTRIVFTTGQQSAIDEAAAWLERDSIYSGVKNKWIVGGGALLLFMFSGRGRR